MDSHDDLKPVPMQLPARPAAATDAQRRFAEFMDRTGKRVHSYIMNRVRRPREIADDLTQESFKNAWARWSTFDASRDELAWILTIAQNVVTDYFKRIGAQKRRPKPGQAAGFEDLFATGPTVETAARSKPERVDEAIFAEQDLALEAAIQSLAERKRTVITLHRARLSHEDIAKRIGVKPGSVGSILSRAVEELKIILAKYIN